MKGDHYFAAPFTAVSSTGSIGIWQQGEIGDHYDSLQDAADHGDRKTRFALLILGSLNATNLVVAMRAETIGRLTQELASLVYTTARSNADKLHALQRVYVGLYVLVALTAGLVATMAWSAFFRNATFSG